VLNCARSGGVGTDDVICLTGTSVVFVVTNFAHIAICLHTFICFAVSSEAVYSDIPVFMAISFEHV
jgi:hypothetical protein